MDLSEDIQMAEEMRNRSHAPYSKYTAGCVLVCKNGKKYMGCNVENAGIQSICAERVAFTKAISEGEKEFSYILTVGGKSGEKPEGEYLPCGYCRQFMNEFVDKDFKIYSVNKDIIREYAMDEIFPYNFQID